MRAADLDLDLDVFVGPFDLLLAIVLREEVSLLDVQLGEIVIAYVEHLEAEGELDLEAATEFLILIAALLELKSRMMLPGEESDDLSELEPGEAAEELLARMLAYRRYRDAGAELAERFLARRGVLHRLAPLPSRLRQVSIDAATKAYEPDLLASAIGDLLTPPPRLDTSHIRPTVSLGQRLDVLRTVLGRKPKLDFDEEFGDEDRLTQAVTLFALLEMHKKGEASWNQSEPFGRIEIVAR